MKKLLIILAVTAMLFSYINKSFAHPGRTNRYGCHRCWTNCEYWGYSYAEYHCH